jgi:ankyrin repeat protein
MSLHDIDQLAEDAAYGKVENVRHLLESKVDPNAKESRYAATALHGAVFMRHVECVELLLAAKADPTILNRHGRSSIDLNNADLRSQPFGLGRDDSRIQEVQVILHKI